jgi:hypothetical protein
MPRSATYHHHALFRMAMTRHRHSVFSHRAKSTVLVLVIEIAHRTTRVPSNRLFSSSTKNTRPTTPRFSPRRVRVASDLHCGLPTSVAAAQRGRVPRCPTAHDRARSVNLESDGAPTRSFSNASSAVNAVPPPFPDISGPMVCPHTFPRGRTPAHD